MPKKNAAFVFTATLIDATSRPEFLAAATLAAGDVKISKDDGAFANLATLPTVTPAGGIKIKVSLSAAEMNADRIDVAFIDQTATKQWDDLFVTILTTADTIDDVSSALATVDGVVDAILADTVAMQGAGFVGSTDSLEAIRNRGDAAWVTGAGGSSPTVEEIRAEIDLNSTQLAAILADTGTTLPATLATLATAAALATVDGVVDAILADTVAMQGAGFVGSTDSLEAIRNRGDAAWVTGAGGSSPTVEEIRAEIDLNSTQLAAILADTGTTLPATLATLATAAALATVDGVVDAILADTVAMQGAGFVGSTDSLEAIRNRGDAAWVTGAGGSSPTVEEIRAEIDLNSTQLAAILTDTGTSLPASLASLATASALATVDANVDAILTDTGTTLPATLATIATAADLAAVDAIVDAILIDTGTTLPATLATIAGYIDTEIAAIKATTDLLPDGGALSSLATAANLAIADALIDAIKAKTDSLTFTKPLELDVNMQSLAGGTITGDGKATPFDIA